MLTMDVNGIDKVKSMLSGINNGAQRAISSAINRTLSKIKTSSKRSVTSEYAVKSGEIEETLSIQKSNFKNLSGMLKSVSPRLPLYNFFRGFSRDGIKVKVKKNEGLKIINGNSKFKGKPFLQTMQTGHRGIFQRKTNNAYPIAELHTVSIPQMLGNESVQKDIEIDARNMLDEQLNREISRILRGYF